MLAALAMSAWLTVSGHAEHFEQARYNEENYGLGIEYRDYSAGVLKDSNGNWSPYASYFWDVSRSDGWDAGVAITAAYRQDARGERYAGLNALPLPYLRWQRDSFGVNIIAAPAKGGFVFFQMKFRISD